MKNIKKRIILFASMLSIVALVVVCVVFTGPRGLKYEQNHDGTYAVVGIGNCKRRKIVIPATYRGEAVTSIDNFAFRGCNNLTSITIPDSVTSFDKPSFQCGYIMTFTDTCAFAGCEKLVSITVDENNAVYHSEGNCIIETASNRLIQGCRSSVIPDYVTVIGLRAFCDCTGLTSITIPDSVTSIFPLAFEGCSSLTSITYTGTMEQWAAITLGTDWNVSVPATEVICSDGIVSISN